MSFWFASTPAGWRWVGVEGYLCYVSCLAQTPRMLAEAGSRQGRRRGDLHAQAGLTLRAMCGLERGFQRQVDPWFFLRSSEGSFLFVEAVTSEKKHKDIKPI